MLCVCLWEWDWVCVRIPVCVNTWGPHQNDCVRYRQVHPTRLALTESGQYDHCTAYHVLCACVSLSWVRKITKEKGMGCTLQDEGSPECLSQLSSSGCCCSKSRTCVKGKWPCLPLHSPSHWPFTLILVTITLSPTCANQRTHVNHTHAYTITVRKVHLVIPLISTTAYLPELHQASSVHAQELPPSQTHQYDPILTPSTPTVTGIDVELIDPNPRL